MELDKIDKEILRALHLKGRLPIVELAKQVNLTTSPCSDRVKRLEKEGFISGYLYNYYFCHFTTKLKIKKQ